MAAPVNYLLMSSYLHHYSYDVLCCIIDYDLGDTCLTNLYLAMNSDYPI
jgi:hypothetical protein